MADGERPACSGKGFEHHQDTEIATDLVGGGGWRCPACGGSGSYSDFAAYSERLASLLPLYYKLHEQMLDLRAVILVPTDGATGLLGTFMGRDVIRVPGLAEPMIAIPKIGPAITVTMPLDNPGARQSAALAAGFPDWQALQEAARGE